MRLFIFLVGALANFSVAQASDQIKFVSPIYVGGNPYSILNDSWKTEYHIRPCMVLVSQSAGWVRFSLHFDDHFTASSREVSLKELSDSLAADGVYSKGMLKAQVLRTSSQNILHITLSSDGSYLLPYLVKEECQVSLDNPLEQPKYNDAFQLK